MAKAPRRAKTCLAGGTLQRPGGRVPGAEARADLSGPRILHHPQYWRPGVLPSRWAPAPRPGPGWGLPARAPPPQPGSHPSCGPFHCPRPRWVRHTHLQCRAQAGLRWAGGHTVRDLPLGDSDEPVSGTGAGVRAPGKPLLHSPAPGMDAPSAVALGCKCPHPLDSGPDPWEDSLRSLPEARGERAEARGQKPEGRGRPRRADLVS